MKSKHLLLVGFALCSLIAIPQTAHAQTTEFTYSGRLNENGAPVNGAYDLRFTLYDANAAGNFVAGPLTVSPVDVANGLFTLRLDFGANVFTGPARWLNIEVRPAGVGNFTPLSPRHEVTSSPYAIRAQTAGTAAAVNVGAVLTSLNGLRDDVTLAAGANVTLTANGNTLTLASSGVGGSGIWSVLNNNAYYTAGKVGIGTTVPVTPMEVNGSVRSTRSGLAIQYIQLDGGDPAAIRLTAQSAVAAEKSLLIQNLSGEATPDANNSIQFVLGTTASPSTKMTLTKDGNVILPLAGSGGAIQFGTPAAETGMSVVGANRADVRFDGSTLKLLAGAGVGIPSSANGIAINTSGNVGIGTTSPTSKLEIAAQNGLAITGFQPYLTLRDTSATNARSIIQNGGGNLLFYPQSFVGGSPALTILSGSGNVGIGTTTPGAKLHAETSEPVGAAVIGEARGSAEIGVGGISDSVNGIGVLGASTSGFGVYADGDAGQRRTKGGFVKAMALIHVDRPNITTQTATVVRCWEGPGQTGNCGFTVSANRNSATVNFGFTVNDRFLSVTGLGGSTPSIYDFPNATTVTVLCGFDNSTDFFIFVF